MSQWKYIVLAVCGFSFILSSQNGLTPYRFPELKGFPPIPERNFMNVNVESAALGRALFYDKLLSRDYSMSCGSCHKQEHAFSDGGKQLSAGIEGKLTARNTMPLFNLAWYSAYFWDGRAESIEAQVFHPVRDNSEMALPWKDAERRVAKSPFYAQKFKEVYGNQYIDSTLIAHAIGQFLRTLISHQSKYDRVLQGMDLFTPEEFEGFVLVNEMTGAGCLHCHSTDANALATSGVFSNNGLMNHLSNEFYNDPGVGAVTGKKADMGRFRVPSLRNIALTAPYMHDGRFANLEEVLDFYASGVHAGEHTDPLMGTNIHHLKSFSSSDRQSIIAFLHTLTDTVFVNNHEFAESR